MSRNSKNAQRYAAARALPKNRSAAARARRADGKPAQSPPRRPSSKKNAWWQKFSSYSAFTKGGKKGAQRDQEAADV